MNTTDTMTITIEGFIAKHDLRMDYRQIDSRSKANDFGQGASHYKVNLALGESLDDMEIEYSMGSAHTTGPQIDDVLDCLAMDAAGIDGSMNFEGWANEYGYDSDSRKAEQTYNQCVQQAEDLKRLLGPRAYQELLYSTERN